MPAATQQIITAVQAALAAGGTVAGARVYVDATDPLIASQLPAILIDEQAETAEPFTISGIEKRSLTLQLHCVLANSTTSAADARTFGLAVETVIANSAALASLCSQGHGITATRPTLQGEGDRAFATRTQDWTFAYLVRSTAPDTIL